MQRLLICVKLTRVSWRDVFVMEALGQQVLLVFLLRVVRVAAAGRRRGHGRSGSRCRFAVHRFLALLGNYVALAEMTTL